MHVTQHFHFSTHLFWPEEFSYRPENMVAGVGEARVVWEEAFVRRHLQDVGHVLQSYIVQIIKH